MKRIKKIIVFSFILFAVLIVSSNGLVLNVSAETETSLFNHYNPNGDSDFAIIYGEKIKIDEFVDKFNECVKDSEGYYTNPNYSHYKYKSNTNVLYSAESPIIAWVDERYFSQLGDFMIVGDEYGYYVHTEYAQVDLQDTGFKNEYAYYNQVLLFDIETTIEKDSGNHLLYEYATQYKILLQADFITLDTTWYGARNRYDGFIINFGDNYEDKLETRNYYVYNGQNEATTMGPYITIPYVKHTYFGYGIHNSDELYIGNFSYQFTYFDDENMNSSEKYSFTNDPVEIEKDGEIYVKGYSVNDCWQFDYMSFITNSVKNATKTLISKENFKIKLKELCVDIVKELFGTTTYIQKNKVSSLTSSYISVTDPQYLHVDNSIHCFAEDMLGVDFGYMYANDGSSVTISGSPDKEYSMILHSPGQSVKINYKVSKDPDIDSFNPYIKMDCSMVGGLNYKTKNLSSTTEYVEPKTIGANSYQRYSGEYSSDKNIVIDNEYISVSSIINLYSYTYYKVYEVDYCGKKYFKIEKADSSNYSIYLPGKIYYVDYSDKKYNFLKIGNLCNRFNENFRKATC